MYLSEVLLILANNLQVSGTFRKGTSTDSEIKEIVIYEV